MNFSEIKKGMVFRENDNRFTRFIKITKVTAYAIFFRPCNDLGEASFAFWEWDYVVAK